MTSEPHPEDLVSMLSVEQRDRNAAVALLEAGDQDWQAKEIRLGQGDHFPIVQAFARHRHQSLSRSAGWEGVQEASEAEGYIQYADAMLAKLFYPGGAERNDAKPYVIARNLARAVKLLARQALTPKAPGEIHEAIDKLIDEIAPACLNPLPHIVENRRSAIQRFAERFLQLLAVSPGVGASDVLHDAISEALDCLGTVRQPIPDLVAARKVLRDALNGSEGFWKNTVTNTAMKAYNQGYRDAAADNDAEPDMECARDGWHDWLNSKSAAPSAPGDGGLREALRVAEITIRLDGERLRNLGRSTLQSEAALLTVQAALADRAHGEGEKAL